MPHRFLLLLAALLLSACPPTLSGDDDDAADDDDATDDDDAADDDDAMDDDDATDDDDLMDDDDDDDDVVIEGCGDVGSGGLWIDGSGATPEGQWIAGELSWDGSILSVAPEFGPAFGVPISGDAADLSWATMGLFGPGRLFFSQGQWGAFSAGGLVAAVTDDGLGLMIAASDATTPVALEEIGFDLIVEPEFGACPDGGVDLDGCGVGGALPMSVSLQQDDIGVGTQLWPGQDTSFGDLLMTYYTGFEAEEVWCEDYPSQSWSWLLWRDLPVPG